jgi:hypothetical protein
LRRILAIRQRYGIATSRQVDVPEVPHRALLVMVHELDAETRQVTALNFGAVPVSGTVRSEHLTAGAVITSVPDGELLTTVDDLHGFGLELPAYAGSCLIVRLVRD